MKNLILIIFFLLSLNLFSQERTIEDHNFRYVYYLITDKATNSEKKIPTGNDAVVTYDSFYKKYTTIWTDNKNIRAQANFNYINSEKEMNIFEDDNKNQYFINDHIKKYDKLFITMTEYSNDKIVTIFFTNKMLK